MSEKKNNFKRGFTRINLRIPADKNPRPAAFKIGFYKFPKKNAQSTLEYLLLITIVLAAILAMVWTHLQPAVQNMVIRSANSINAAVERLP